MSVAIEPLYQTERTESVTLARLRRLALPFEVGFAILVGLSLLLLVAVLALAYLPGGYVTFNSEGGFLTLDPSTAPSDAVTVGSLLIATQVFGLIAGLAIQGALIFSLWSLYKLFGLYRKGTVFAAAPVGYMRRAGGGVALFAVLPGLLQPLLRRLGSPDENWFRSETIPLLLIGGGLFLFSYIIALGMELQRENKEFV